MSNAVRRGIDRLRDGYDTDDTKLFLVDNFIWVLLFLAVVAFGIWNGRSFFNLSNLRFIAFSTVTLAFLVMAEGVCLISGNFDLSIGQAAGFAAMLNGMLLTSWAPWLPWYLGVVTIILIGIGIGSVNGFLVGKMDLDPFLVTLGTFFILQFGTLEVSLQSIRSGFPEPYLAIGGDSVYGVPIALLMLVAVVAFLHVSLRHMRFGNRLYAVGDDPDAASRLGINVEDTVFWTFVLSGVLSAVAGLLFTGFLGSVTPSMADGSLFMAFAGAVLGGTSLAGGRGSIVNMIGGALLIGVFQSGLVMSGANGNQVNIFFGVLVLIAILLNRTRERVRDDLLHPE